MAHNQSIQVKICCIKSLREAQMAIDYGAHAIGLVGAMPSGPGVIDDELIRSIAMSVGDKVETFLLTSETRADQIIAHHARTQTATIQLVDQVPVVDLVKIKDALQHVRLVQVLHVLDQSSISKASEVAPHVDALLLDSGNPNGAIKTLGGTGNTHNWQVSKAIVETIDIPVYLAGGLRSANVCNAIDLVKPHGVDLCSGVRTNDLLDEEKLGGFMNVVR